MKAHMYCLHSLSFTLYFFLTLSLVGELNPLYYHLQDTGVFYVSTVFALGDINVNPSE